MQCKVTLKCLDIKWANLPPWPWVLAGGSGYIYLVRAGMSPGHLPLLFPFHTFYPAQNSDSSKKHPSLCEELTIRNMPDPLCPSSLVSQGPWARILKERPVPQTQPHLAEHLVRLGSGHPTPRPHPCHSSSGWGWSWTEAWGRNAVMLDLTPSVFILTHQLPTSPDERIMPSRVH